MTTFRTIIFWAHLIAGVISGVAIGIMCVTGTALAFEKELMAWAERDARRVAVPTGAAALPLEELQRRVRDAHPDARPATIVFQNNPGAAVAFGAGRGTGYFVDPYTGEVRQPRSFAMGQFMQTMLVWHRYLGFSGEVSRPRGKWINGVCNVAFCVLAITGLYLWMPRSWSWRAVKPVIWFRQNSTSKARDFNWHNAIGFWTAPVLIVLTLTAIPISFQWGGRVIAQLTGTTQAGGGAAAVADIVEVPPVPPGTALLPQQALVAAVQREIPRWQTITIRTGAPAGRGGRGGPGGVAISGGRGRGAAETVTGQGGAGRGEQRVQAATFTVREAGTWPRTATTTVAVNPYTGDVLRRTGYAEMPAAQQVRAWTRFLHTGEAVGKFGQFAAGLACLGGCFLVYTGMALAWRRFFIKPKSES